MAGPKINSVKEHIAWSYANLARAHAAVKAGATSYGRTHHMIRARLFKGLTTGNMQMRSLYDDEKVKYQYPQACCYCGAVEPISIDHLIPRIRGGGDHADNLVWACISCNSSKSDRDLLEWSQLKGRFPSILLLRRYTKLVTRYCEQQGLLELPLAEALQHQLPFKLQLLPYDFPDLSNLVLWVSAKPQRPNNS